MKWLRVWLVIWWALGIPLAAQSATGGARIDVQEYQVDVELVPENSYLRGEVRITFQVLEDAVSLPFDLSSRLSLIRVTDENDLSYSSSFDNLNSSRMAVRGEEPFRAGSTRQLIFSFDGTLESEEYAYLDDSPRAEKAVVMPDRSLLLSEGKWFPSHLLPLDTAQAQLRISVPLGFTAVGPGRLEGIETVGVNEVFVWKSESPIGSFPVVVSRFFRQQFEHETLPLTFYVTEDFNQDLKPWAEQIWQVADFYTEQLGPAPSSRLNLVTVGNVDLPSSGSLGLLLLDSKFFGARSIRVPELAERIAHQWWREGLRVHSSGDVWLQDGFSTYLALRFVEEKLPDRFEAELARLSVDALKYEDRGPIASGLALNPGSEAYRSIVCSKSAWVLYMLGRLAGKEEVDSAVRDWYREKSGQDVTTSELVEWLGERLGQDYRWFFVQWVESTGVPEFRVEYRILKKSAGGFRVRGEIKQDLELFRMPMEVLIETKGEPEEKSLNVAGKQTSFNFETETMPLRIELDPKGKILRNSEKIQVAVHLALGEEYLESGEFVSAIREFEKAKTMAPRSSLAHYRLGETFFLQHSYSNAANSFRDAQNGDLKPEWVETWIYIHLGKIYDVLGQRQRALAEYQKAINTKNDYNGAQQEAQKYINEPFSKPRSVIN